MSSTTEITMNFSNNTTFTVTLGSRDVADRFYVEENREEIWERQKAMDCMYGIKFQNALPLWHRNLVNLMLMEEIRAQEDRNEYNPAPEEVYAGVMLIFRHIR